MRFHRSPAALGFLVGAATIAVLAGLIWLALPRLNARATPPTASAVVSAQVAGGQQLYEANCQTCHGGPTGGAMMDYPPKHNANGHTWHHADCELTEIIKTGAGPMIDMMREMMAPPGAPTMPAWREKLTDGEIDAVLAYIKTMWTPEERDVQAEVTQETCS